MSENDVTKALEIAKDKFGGLDVAVNCAGTGVAFKIYNFNKNYPHSLDDFTRVMMVCKLGSYYFSRLDGVIPSLLIENNIFSETFTIHELWK